MPLERALYTSQLHCSSLIRATCRWGVDPRQPMQLSSESSLAGHCLAPKTLLVMLTCLASSSCSSSATRSLSCGAWVAAASAALASPASLADLLGTTLEADSTATLQSSRPVCCLLLPPQLLTCAAFKNLHIVKPGGDTLTPVHVMGRLQNICLRHDTYGDKSVPHTNTPASAIITACTHLLPLSGPDAACKAAPCLPVVPQSCCSSSSVAAAVWCTSQACSWATT